MSFIRFPKLLLRKVALGIVLIALAAAATFFIKENLDTRDPTSALPSVTVKYNDTVIDSAYIVRASYSWNFLTTIENSPVLSVEDVPLTPFNTQSAKKFELSFSKKPQEIKISRADGRSARDFVEIITQEQGVFNAPSLPGYYVYKIEVAWGARGSILYYFAIQTRND